MTTKSKFDIGTLIGLHLGAGGSRMIAELVVEKYRLFNYRVVTQNIPDTVAMLMAGKPFEVGNATRCDYNDIRV